MNLTGDSVIANSAATLQCSVTLNQYSSYSSGTVVVMLELIHAMSVVTSTSASGSSDTRAANFMVASVDVSEAGLYRCRATMSYTGRNDQFVEEPLATDSSTAVITLQSKNIKLFDIIIDCPLPNTIK